MAINKILDVGLMRFSGTLKNNSPIANGSGGYDDSYSDVFTCRGYLEKDKGGVNLLTGQVVFNKDYTWTVRYQSAIVVNPDSIWVIRGEVYTVKDYEKVDELPHFYIFRLTKDE